MRSCEVAINCPDPFQVRAVSFKECNNFQGSTQQHFVKNVVIFVPQNMPPVHQARLSASLTKGTNVFSCEHRMGFLGIIGNNEIAVCQGSYVLDAFCFNQKAFGDGFWVLSWTSCWGLIDEYSSKCKHPLSRGLC